MSRLCAAATGCKRADPNEQRPFLGAGPSKYRSAGQSCVCAKHLFARTIFQDAFVARLTETVNAMKIGDGFEPGVNIGPLINVEAVQKIAEHIADAVKKSALIVRGGHSYPRDISSLDVAGWS